MFPWTIGSMARPPRHGSCWLANQNIWSRSASRSGGGLCNHALLRFYGATTTRIFCPSFGGIKFPQALLDRFVNGLSLSWHLPFSLIRTSHEFLSSSERHSGIV